MTSHRIALLLVLPCLAFAACGSDEKASQKAAAPAPTSTPTPGGGGPTAVAACVNDQGAALDLTATADNQRLEMDGVDARLYDVVRVDQEGAIAQQVVVYASTDDATTGAGQFAANGFFDDVRPAGRALVIRRGGDEASTTLVEECAFHA